MARSWERRGGETDEWYQRFRIFLYMGPDRTVAGAYRLAIRLGVGGGSPLGAVPAHGQLRRWQRIARRDRWWARAADFDREVSRNMRVFVKRLLAFYEAEAARYFVADEQGGLAGDVTGDDAEREVEKRWGWLGLRDLLAQLYPDEVSARRIVAQSGLESARIEFGARALDMWHAILTEAEHSGRLLAVMREARKEYRANKALADAIRGYRAWRAAGNGT